MRCDAANYGFDHADGLARIRTSLAFGNLDEVPFAPLVASMKKL